MSITLYPSEQKAIEAIVKEEAAKLRNKTFNTINLSTFADTVMDRINKLGFIAVVNRDIMSPDNYELIGENDLVFSPKVDVISRISNTGIDFDKMQYETQHGILDGKAYKIDAFGNKKSVD